jgi:pyruvate/2-oxoglutarate dehydrogenase complex dihydrolipoamide dehydrogenase (E3) component
VDVYLGEGRFSAADAVEVAGRTLRFATAVIATGARAVRPIARRSICANWSSACTRPA